MLVFSMNSLNLLQQTYFSFWCVLYGYVFNGIKCDNPKSKKNKNTWDDLFSSLSKEAYNLKLQSILRFSV